MTRVINPIVRSQSSRLTEIPLCPFEAISSLCRLSKHSSHLSPGFWFVRRNRRCPFENRHGLGCLSGFSQHASKKGQAFRGTRCLLRCRACQPDSISVPSLRERRLCVGKYRRQSYYFSPSRFLHDFPGSFLSTRPDRDANFTMVS